MARNNIPHTAPNGQNTLSNKLTLALVMEEYHRTSLLFWKQIRQQLETQIPINDPFGDFLKELVSKDAN